MKLSDLRGAIRKTKGNPSVVVEFAPGLRMTLMLQKTPLLEDLGRQFGEDRTAETGLTFDESLNIISGPLSPAPHGIDANEPDLEEAMRPVGGSDDEDDDLL